MLLLKVAPCAGGATGPAKAAKRRSASSTTT